MMKKKLTLFAYLILTLFGFQYGIANDKAPTIYIDESIKGLNINSIPDDLTVYHIYSHGRPGELLLEGKWKDAEEIADFLKENLPRNIGHVNIYGCEFAKGSKGLQAVKTIEERLGVSVSGSDNLTGKDGDWYLEVGSPAEIIKPFGFNYNLQCTTSPTMNSTDNTGCDSFNGSITVTNALTPISDYSFSIDGGVTFQSGNVFSNLAPGVYNVRYRNNVANCMSAVVQRTITDSSSAPTTPSASPGHVTNCTAPNGSITITTPTPLANYTFSIDGGATFHTNTTFSNLPTGTYSVIARSNATGCKSAIRTVTINNPSLAMPNVTPTHVTSCSAPNGSLNITSPNPADYTFSIDGGLGFHTNNIFNNLSAGTYSVVAKANATGCITSARSVTINPPAAVNMPNATPTNVTSCVTPNGVITVTFPTPLANYTFSIDGGVTFQASPVFSGLVPGTYSVVARSNATGCISAPRTTTVGYTPAMTATPSGTVVNNSNCEGTANGSITITGYTPIANYVFSINGGLTYQASNVFTNLSVGIYYLRVRNLVTSCETNIAEKTITDSFATVNQPNGPTTASSSCIAPNGTITFNTPAPASHSFSIDGGVTFQPGNVFSGLAPGSYSVVAKSNATGCVSAARTMTVSNSPAVPTPNTAPLVHPTSCESPNGVITVNSPSPLTNYIFSKDGGITFQSSPVFNGLAPGTYSIVAKSIATGCISGVRSVTLNQPSVTIPTASVTNHVTSCTVPNGRIAVTAPTPLTNYTFSIDGGVTFQASPIFENLSAGTYSVVARSNATGCISGVRSLTVNNPSLTAPGSTAVNNTSCSNPNGTITFTTPTPFSDYQFSINGGTTWQSSPYFTGLSGGTYVTMYKTISTGCISNTANRTVSDNVGTISDPVYTSTAASSCDIANGIITITSPLSAIYEYSIDRGVTFQNSNVFTGLSVGPHFIIVRNKSTGCISREVFAPVNNPANNITIQATVTNPANCSSKGSITFTAPIGPDWLYSIDDGVTFHAGNVFNNLDIGNYIVRARKVSSNCVSDPRLFRVENLFILTAPAVTNVSKKCSAGGGVKLGSIEITSPYSPSYEYSVDGGITFSSGRIFTGLESGTYKVLYRNKTSGCNSDITYVLIQDLAKNCVDSDGDGVPDFMDMDMDNDGITNSDECGAYVGWVFHETKDYVGPEYWEKATVEQGQLEPHEGYASLDPNAIIDGNLSGEIGAGDPFLEFSSPTNTDIFQPSIVLKIDLKEPQPVGYFLIVNDRGICGDGWYDYFIELYDHSDNLLGKEIIYHDTSCNVIKRHDFTNIYENVSYIRLIAVEGQVGGGRGTSIQINQIGLGIRNYEEYQDCALDTDGDGIPNHLDLDSDNDGCLDAVEGGASIGTSQTVDAGGILTVGTGSSAPDNNLCSDSGCVDANGIPIIVDFGQSVGNSQNASVSTCLLESEADLYATITDGSSTYISGTINTYTIVVGNNGPSNVNGATVVVPIPSGIESAYVSYTAITENGATTSVSGTQYGNISDTVNLPVGSTVTYTVKIMIPLDYVGDLTYSVTIPNSPSYIDIDPTNNSDTDVDTSKTDCFKMIDPTPFAVYSGETKTFVMPEADFGFVLNIYYLDNSFNMKINGTLLADQELEFWIGLPLNVYFTDGHHYGDGTIPHIWEIAGSPGSPLLQVIIAQDGSVSFFGSRSSNGPLEPLELRNGNFFNTIPWNTNGSNSITVTQNIVGTTYLTGEGIGLKNISCNEVEEACYRPGLFVAGGGLKSVTGISTLSRGSESGGEWEATMPKNGFLVLESKEKGFVITRMENPETGISNPVEGMLVFDTDDNCLKMFDGIKWFCLQQGCVE